MSRLAVLLCLIAVAAAQVPWITCTSDCHEVVFAGLVFAGLGAHDCHGPCARDAHDDHVGCHASDCTHDDEPEPPVSEHDVFQVPVLRSGSPVELPTANAVATAVLARALVLPLLAPASALREEARGDPEPAGPPDDLLTSVRLLI